MKRLFSARRKPHKKTMEKKQKISAETTEKVVDTDYALLYNYKMYHNGYMCLCSRLLYHKGIEFARPQDKK